MRVCPLLLRMYCVWQQLNVFCAERTIGFVAFQHGKRTRKRFRVVLAVDAGHLHMHSAVKVAVKAAPAAENTELFRFIFKVVVHIVKEQRHGVIVFRHAAKPVLVHAQIRNRLLCAVGVPAVRFRLTSQLFELLLLRPRQLNAGFFRLFFKRLHLFSEPHLPFERGVGIIGFIRSAPGSEPLGFNHLAQYGFKRAARFFRKYRT